MRRLFAMALVATLVAVIWLVEREKPAAPVGLNPPFQVLGDAQRQAERLLLTMTRVSEAEEEALGGRMAAHYGLGEEKIEGKAEIEAHLKRLGGRLADRVVRKSLSYRFYLVRGTNAFALPGGHVAVGLELLKLMKSEDELAAVLGHEMAHVDRRHCIERLQYELAARKVGLDIAYILASIPVNLFHAGYSKNQEMDADRIGLQFAVAEGYSPQGAIDLFGRTRERQEGGKTGKKSPTGEVGDLLRDLPVAYFRSHPPLHERIAGVEREIRSQGWKKTPVRPLTP